MGEGCFEPEGAAVLQLLAGEDQALLIRGDALLVLNLLLNVVDGVGRLHLQGDGLASQSLDENLWKVDAESISLLSINYDGCVAKTRCRLLPAWFTV
jgi:hypothetical protein